MLSVLLCALIGLACAGGYGWHGGLGYGGLGYGGYGGYGHGGYGVGYGYKRKVQGPSFLVKTVHHVSKIHPGGHLLGGHYGGGYGGYGGYGGFFKG